MFRARGMCYFHTYVKVLGLYVQYRLDQTKMDPALTQSEIDNYKFRGNTLKTIQILHFL